jgi:hypothetical protein
MATHARLGLKKLGAWPTQSAKAPWQDPFTTATLARYQRTRSAVELPRFATWAAGKIRLITRFHFTSGTGSM